ncbi:ankyrin repeat domain-containing protein [Magnetococcales bacterium HHB-1]
MNLPPFRPQWLNRRFSINKLTILSILTLFIASLTWAHQKNHRGWDDILQNAARIGDQAVIQHYLKEGLKINQPDPYGRTLLHWAVSQGNEKLTQELLKKGADPRARNRKHQDRTPLHEAISQGHVPLFKLLLKHGAQVTDSLKDQTTPLHLAVARQQEEITKILLKKNAHINPKDNQGRTPLFRAAKTGNITLVKHLLKHKADKNIKNNDHLLPWQIADEQGYPKIVTLLNPPPPIIKKKSPPVPTMATNGVVALHRQATQAEARMAQRLLREEARREAEAPAELMHDEASMAEESAPSATDTAETMGFAPPPPASPTAATPSRMRLTQKKAKKKEQIKTWKRSTITPNYARLKIGDQEELPLSALQTNVHIDGFRARVVIDTFYYNDKNQQFEGNFQLRLPEGATPYFLAFGALRVQSDLQFKKPIFLEPKEAQQMHGDPEKILEARAKSWDKPKVARMVSKTKAAHAYGETVRKSVDPALMEWSGAGVFSTKVFPLEAKTMHRIVIAYDMDLNALASHDQFRLDLPSNTEEHRVDITITQPKGVEIEVLPKGEKIHSTKKIYHAHFESPKTSHITVNISQPKTLLLTGKDPETGDYFATRFTPDLPDTSRKSNQNDAIFLIDTSLSANPDQINVWLQMLETILENNRDQIKQFAVAFFNIETNWWRQAFTPNTKENVQALMRYAHNLSLEGATDLSTALKEANLPTWYKQKKQNAHWDIFLLSDGAITWGEDNLHSLSTLLQNQNRKALFAYRGGFSGTDTRMLQHLTRISGGALFSVMGEKEVNKAAKAHRSRPWYIEKVTLKGAQDHLFAGQPTTIYPGQSLTLVGRGPLKDQTVQLTLQQGQIKKQISIPLPQAINSPLTPRIYGQVAVSQLEAFEQLTEALAKAYASHFRVTGPSSSLLMLESEADYQRFNIKPKENAFVVQSALAKKAIQQAQAQKDAALISAKKRFISWVEQLNNQPGFSFEQNLAFKMALEKMPESAFIILSERLDSLQRTRQTQQKQTKKALNSQSLDYDLISDEAQRRWEDYGATDALRVLSSLIERAPGDTVMARDVAYTTHHWGLPGHAYYLLRRTALARPYEPQTYHALAQVLSKMQQTDLAIAFYEIGLAGKWPGRFGSFSHILTLDYLRLLQQIQRGKQKTSIPHFAKARLKRLQKKVKAQNGADLVIIISWNTDRTDIDLHVEEPTGEVCYYQNKQTRIGGQITQDVTQGFGPEMYWLPAQKPGTYTIRAKYYASDRNRASTRTKVFMTLIRHWGEKNEQITQKVITLKKRSAMHHLATIEIPEKR